MSLFRPEVREAQNTRLDGAIVLSPYKAHVRFAALLVAIAISGIVWLALSSFARVERVPGLLVTTQPMAKVSPPRGGVALQVFVSEGDEVQAGQPLVLVDTDVRSTVGQSTAEGSETTARVQISLLDRQLGTIERQFEIERSQLASNDASLSEQEASVIQQIGLQRESVASQKESFDRISEIVDSGFIPRVEHERRRQSYLTSEQTLIQLRQQLSSLRADRTRIQADIASSQFRLERELSTVRGNMEALEQRRLEFAGSGRFTLTAPVSGTVTTLQVAAGQTVQQVIPVLSIVPADAQMEVYLYAPTRAVGLVEVGQDVTVAVDAFPYQRFGTIRGTISGISRSILDPAEADVPFELREPVYRISVLLKQQFVTVRGNRQPLQPGMTLTGNIVLERQTFLEWLLAPLTAVSKRVS